ncbi:MAG: type I-G CRISPR-associated protein Csb2 [Stellaceae bacterium]
MRLVLRQSFPLGRFHATPWRINPFDDPYGEWPPSPWRLTRAVVARWYQWRREEAGTWPEDQIKKLIGALCTSNYCFYLPDQARQSTIMRQYQPVEFGSNPAAKKAAGIRSYGISLTQDNAWCIPPDDNLFWFVEGDGWTPELSGVLHRCLERIVYFDRAEALTCICLTDEAPISANVTLTESRTSSRLAPVLVPCFDATRTDVERVTQDPLAARNIPQGARLLYAQRPARPPAREAPRRMPMRPDTHLVQFALGWTVAPKQRATVRLTARRAAVLRNLYRMKTGNLKATWSDVPAGIRDEIAGMTGKDARGEPLRGPRAHAGFLLWWDGGVPTRLLVWRGARPFDEDEQEAMLSAAAQELSWAATGPDAPKQWKIKLIPLDTTVPAPPGFDGASAMAWRTLTPYVPSRHHLRGGKVRESETIESQIRRELAARGYGATLLSVEEIEPPTWVAVHVPRRQAGQQPFIGDRRGYRLRLCFEAPIFGPLRHGHSSSFGLGIFVPA